MAYAHGIGAFLNVHEGPFGIGGGSVSSDAILASPKMRRLYLAPMLEGYHVSNEPGFYLDGAFGIRVEADLLVEAAATKYEWGTRPYLRFRNLTPVPFCRALIDTDLLSEEEIKWID